MRYFVKKKDGTMVLRRRTRDEFNSIVGDWARFYVGCGRGGYNKVEHAWFAYRQFRFRRQFNRDVGCGALTRSHTRIEKEDADSVFFVDL